MKPSPPGWPRIATALYYEDPGAAVDWLRQAFGFESRLIVEDDDGAVEHAELVFGGDGLVMIAKEKPQYPYRRAPSRIGGVNTQNTLVYVDDVDAHCQRARAAGAKILEDPSTVDYGEEHFTDRGYHCEDPGGHIWWFYQRLRTA